MNIIDETGATVSAADVAIRVGAVEMLPTENQAAAVTVMLSNSRTGILASIAILDLPAMREARALLFAMEEMAKQRKMGQETMDELKILDLRLQRGIGQGVKEGQRQGTIASNKKDISIMEMSSPASSPTSSPRDWMPNSGTTQTQYYAMADEKVTDEIFDEVLEEAKEEGKLTRKNVADKSKMAAHGITQDDLDALQVPKAKKKTETQPAAKGKVFGPKPQHKEMLNRLAIQLDGLAFGVDSITDLNDNITKDEASQLAASLAKSIRSLNRIRSLLKEHSQ